MLNNLIKARGVSFFKTSFFCSLEFAEVVETETDEGCCVVGYSAPRGVDKNMFTGALPTEMGLLTSLIEL